MTGHSGTYLLAPSSPLSRLLLILPCSAPQHLRYPYWGLHRSPNVHHKRIRRPSTFLITASGTRFAASLVAPLIPAECNANASAGISFAPLHTFLQRFTFFLHLQSHPSRIGLPVPCPIPSSPPSADKSSTGPSSSTPLHCSCQKNLQQTPCPPSCLIFLALSWCSPESPAFFLDLPLIV